MKQETNLGNKVQSVPMGSNPETDLREIKSVQLAKGISVEQMEAEFFDNATLREPNYRLFQLNSRGKRYYYNFDGNEPVFYPSVTTILHNVMPENKNLTDWKVSKGKEEAEAYSMEKARYGSFIHTQLAELMIAGKYDLDKVGEKLAAYCDKNDLPLAFAEMYEDEAQADLVAFAKWMYEYQVKPLAVEISLYSPTYGYAGTIDLVCEMREYPLGDTRKKAQTDNRIFAICDYKTGKKGFYPDYAVQLELYRMMWNEQYPDTPIERIFNVAPKDWRGTARKVPSYSFEEQTENPEIECIPEYLSLFKKKFQEDRKFAICGGVIDLTHDSVENVQVMDLTQMVKKRKEETEDVVYSDDPSTLFSEEE